MRRELLGCGLSGDGQLGLGSRNFACVKVPDQIVGAPYGIHGTAVQSVACGEKHTLMLAEDGKMWSVGGNEDGQLGRGGRGPGSYTIYPVSFTGGVEIIQITAGRSHSLAVAEDGRLFAWGSNEHGQLALPHNVRWQETPKRISTLNEVVQVATGPDHCIALLESGLVMVWGEQHDGAILHSPTVVHHLIGIPIVRVSAGGRHCVALSASGAVYTWGQNDFGQLGTGDMRGRPTPYFLEGMSSMGIVEVCCGDSHTVLLNKEGRLFGFGSDAYGQLGCGRKFDKHITPAAVTELMGSHVTRVACGRNHTIVIIGGRVYPFGQNANGQLGNGSVLNQVTPKQTDELDHVCAVFAGWDQTFFMRVAGVQDFSPGPSCRLNGPKFLSKDMVIDLLLKHDKMELIGLIESVFSSVSSINGSFLYVDDRRFLSDPKTFGVNLDDVMDTFNALASSPDARQYAELVMDMCQMSVFSDDFDASQLHSVESLRVFLILPWLETFVVNVTRTTVTALHRPFSNAIMRLKPNSRLILEKWWLGLQVRHFNRIVTAMLSAVRCLVLDKVDPSECLAFLDVLSSLSTINKGTNKIPLENFYIHELNNNYNLKQDYANWTSASNQIKQNAPFWSSYPFLMNGAAKGELLHVEALISMHTSINDARFNLFGFELFVEQPFFELTVRRDHIIHDTLNGLATGKKYLQRPLKVQFMNEEAEDAGGVKKEFFMILFQKILQSDYGMFTEDENSHLVWFSGFSGFEEELENYRMVGTLCGLAVYNSILVAFPFPLVLYKVLLDQQPTLEDLCELSPVEGRSLQELLDYQGDDFEDVFCLTFTFSCTALGQTETVDLKTEGSKITVTQLNKNEYVQLYVRNRLLIGLNGEIGRQANAFKDGFRMVANSRVVSFFQPRELMELVVGNENYDWTEFKKIVIYKGEYHANHPAIIAFWEAFFELSVEEKKQFLQFLMGSTRLPVSGMSGLQVFIQPTAPEILPVAHTCFNLLDLPNLSDSKELLRRLRISIQHTQGFTLV